ncbi:lysozyme [Novosphingobium sp. Gsoil 351]|uniref:lysozyme n=1 Tax=Novosphingobium sp. Gsoil 351 TaxID=2675225 RepID=UPI0012B4D41D|nr:hypothetical protein [Novosphingobium sp. Gsoil 351]QGN54670.1 hypothetical protein GKE62_09000 [Novosphingobium sp. Gsoil 351]
MTVDSLTPHIVSEIIRHEGLAREAYRDSAGVWTWSMGITDASGHRVGRYRDNPQSIKRCLEVFVWLLSTRYLPAVFAAFKPCEHQLAAALLFHYNTGAIGRATWLKRFLDGDLAAAREAIRDWRRPPTILARRRRERDLFFAARWSRDGSVAVYDVEKSTYRPVRPERISIEKTLEGLLVASATVADGPPAPACGAVGPTEKSAPNWFERLFG